MANDIIKELWWIKDSIAREHGYDIDSLVVDMRARGTPAGQRVVDLRAMTKTTENGTPADANRSAEIDGAREADETD